MLRTRMFLCIVLFCLYFFLFIFYQAKMLNFCSLSFRFYEVNDITQFALSRPFYRGKKDKDNEFAVRFFFVFYIYVLDSSIYMFQIVLYICSRQLYIYVLDISLYGQLSVATNLQSSATGEFPTHTQAQNLRTTAKNHNWLRA